MNKGLIAFLFALCSFSFLVAQKNISLIGHLPYSNNLNDIWGYEDTTGTEYALVGVINGLSIVSLDTPSNPKELFFIPGPTSTWRDIKTYDQFAYVSNETSNGILIVDLTSLPNTIDTLRFTGDTLNLQTIHNLFVDENGILYAFGSNIFGGGAVMFDLNTDPKNPDYVGYYGTSYIHDGYVRNDTLWSSEIYEGWLAGVDITDKSQPNRFATRPTPNSFTHNNWMSDDGKYMFTTDELTGSFVTAYNIEDVNNIKEVSRYQSQPGTGVIPHNTFYLNGYLVTSYYKNGVVITDANLPENLVEVGNFDTSPLLSDNGYNGCWGVYPFANSGLLFASDIEEGLFILQPTYNRACYLAGNVKDDATGFNVNGVQAEIIGTPGITSTNILGDYKTGAVDSGSYVVRFVKNGCLSKYVTGVQLFKDSTVTLNVEITCPPVNINNSSASIFSLTASPTIFNSSTQLSYKIADNDALITVFNLQGQSVYQLQVNESKGLVDLELDLAKGSYLVNLTSKSHNLTTKIIKT